MTTNAYTFLPWLRAGISATIDTDPGAAQRASVPVELVVSSDTTSLPVSRNVQLYGPGDVIGIDPRAISRVEPRPGVGGVEPNFLAHIEFVEEDFPWRYSPAPSGPATGRLAPWLALVVLAADAEFTEASGADPLPAIDVTDPAGTLPPHDQLGAWAHVHVDGSLIEPIATDSTGEALAALQTVLRANPDSACARLICPRHLEPDTAYEAFLVPAFETGRLAGLGLDPAVSPGALYAAWGPHYPNRPAESRLPYYHRWTFRTGSSGDFESLVRLLTPRTADAAVGRRPVDVHRTPGLPDIDEHGGVLPLGGALRVPNVVDPAENWDNFAGDPDLPPYPHPFQRALAGLVNLADDYQRQAPAQAHATTPISGPAAALTSGPPGADADAGPDPIITPPLYGRWHAVTARLLTDQDGTDVPPEQSHNWVHRLNLDPRFRVAANLGAQVVRTREEELMAAAWAQVGDVLVANGRIRAAQLAREVGTVLQTKHLDPPAGTSLSALAESPQRSGRALTLTAPAHPRVTTAASTDGTPGLVTDTGDTVAVGFRVASSRVAAAPVSPQMRRIVRPGARLVRTLDFPEGRRPDGLLSRMDDPVTPVVAAPVKTTPGALVTPLDVTTVLHPERPPDADPVDVLPHSPDFVLRFPGDAVAQHPGAERAAGVWTDEHGDPARNEPGDSARRREDAGSRPANRQAERGNPTTDSAEATRFKTALRELHQGFDAGRAVGATPEPPTLDLAATTADTLTGLRSDDTVPRALLDGAVRLPDRLRPFAEAFTEAMAYPVFTVPMFRSLLDISLDAFVPNLNLVPSNSLTLLENNYEFIESYLAGLNNEMARELLWREFPTDQRGTPFRQFWDALSPAGDIPPMHEWSTGTRLGDNANRRGDLVLVVRGELLRKYPTTAVYAHRAEWPPGGDGLPDRTQPRRLVENPSADQIELPRYEATVDPDIYLLGFDLTADAAVGGPDDPGWFFVLKERPGDPRFGVDDGPAVPVEVWNDLTWSDVDPAGRGFLVLDPAVTVRLAGFDGSDDDVEKADQRAEDENLPPWSANLSSADLAYLLFQVPVMVAVHAKEMIPR